MVPNQIYDWELHDQATSRSSVLKFQRSDHGRDPVTGSRARKGPSRKYTARKYTYREKQAKERQGIMFLSLVPPLGQHHRSMLGEVKNGR